MPAIERTAEVWNMRGMIRRVVGYLTRGFGGVGPAYGGVGRRGAGAPPPSDPQRSMGGSAGRSG